MKAILISSFKFDSVSRTDIAPPLNLLYIAAVMRNSGVEPILFDMNLITVSSPETAEKERLAAVKVRLTESRPDIIGISCLTTSHFPFMHQSAAMARRLFPNAIIILGGVHATLFAKEILENCPEFNYIVLGEGEEQTAELCKAFINGNVKDLSHIQSLGWRDPSGKVIVNPRINYITELDLLPMPAWDMIDFSLYYLDHSNWYNPKKHNIKISIPILSTRSCPYACNFCSAHKTMGRGFRKRSPSNVVDEIEYHIDKYAHNYFGFADDNLTLDKRHALDVFNEITKRGLDIQFESFNGYNLASLDAEVVDAMAQAGCIYAILPIEHGSDRMRNQIIGKKLPREKIFEVMNLYRKHRIQTRAMFIMGFPEDTSETLQETLTMIEALSPDMADVFTLIPFPGTKIFSQSIRDNLFIRQVDENKLWDGSLSLDTKGADFYIKPYAMSLDELADWRHKFNDVSAAYLARRKK